MSTSASEPSSQRTTSRGLHRHPYTKKGPRAYRRSISACRLTQTSALTAYRTCVRTLLRIDQAALFTYVNALSTRVSWTRIWPVPFSSVGTLRRALVCTLPLLLIGSNSTPEAVASRSGLPNSRSV